MAKKGSKENPVTDQDKIEAELPETIITFAETNDDKCNYHYRVMKGTHQGELIKVTGVGLFRNSLADAFNVFKVHLAMIDGAFKEETDIDLLHNNEETHRYAVKQFKTKGDEDGEMVKLSGSKYTSLGIMQIETPWISMDSLSSYKWYNELNVAVSQARMEVAYYKDGGFDLPEEEPPQTWEEWLEEEKWNYEDGDEDEGDYSFDEAEARKDYEDYRKSQQEDYEAFLKAKEQGQFIEAYVVAGSKAGKTVLIKLKNEAAKKQADAIASGDDNDAILAEIASIESREIRNTELDAEKVYAKVQEFFMKSDVIQGSGRSDMKLTQNEIIGIVLSLREAGGYQYKKWLEDTYGLSDDYHLQPDSLKSIEGLTELGLNDCLLMFMKEKLPLNLGNPNISHLKKAEAKAVYNITMDYHSTAVKKAEVEQGEVAENRIQRLEKRIQALKKKMK